LDSRSIPAIAQVPSYGAISPQSFPLEVAPIRRKSIGATIQLLQKDTENAVQVANGEAK